MILNFKFTPHLLGLFMLIFVNTVRAAISSEPFLDGNVSVNSDDNASQAKSHIAYVIPVQDQIGPPILDILRRGLKSAIQEKADIVILDMDTPGGELGVTLEIMEEIISNLERFKGKIITYVNDEAISAGAYIAIASSEIAFSPKSQIGAAEAVSGGGSNIDSSMKRKINSYLKAKIRNYAGDYRYRSLVMSAMMDANESLIIEGDPIKATDGSLIKKRGELLTLTGEEACQLYGSPPAPLLGFGVFETYDEILLKKWGAGNYKIIEMNVNWAEKAGLWLNGIAPLVLSIGLVCIFVEFKTAGFGVFGVLGIILLLVFFGSKYVAGLAGQEELIVFLLGICLILVEIFLAPGLIIPGIIGFFMMIGSIFWAMVDIWPTPDFTWSFEVFRLPFWELLQSLGIAITIGVLLSMILPKTPLWNHLVLSETLGDAPSNSKAIKSVLSTEGMVGRTVSELFPSGLVQINGKRYEARAVHGRIAKGEKIKVIKIASMDLIVEEVSS